MKLSLERFRSKKVHIKIGKRDKIPNQCFKCNKLSNFKNNITTYYYCGDVNNFNEGE